MADTIVDVLVQVAGEDVPAGRINLSFPTPNVLHIGS